MYRRPGLLLAVALLAGCGGGGGADPGTADDGVTTIPLADVAGADAAVLGLARTDDGRSAVLLSPPSGPLTLADVDPDGTVTPVAVPGLDTAQPALTRIAATRDAMVVVGSTAGQLALVVVGAEGAGQPTRVGTVGAADVVAALVTAHEDLLHLALSRIDGTALLLTVDPATGSVRGEVPLAGTPRGIGSTGDGGVAVATDTGRSAVVVTVDPGTGDVTEVPLGPGSAGPLATVDGELFATVGGTDDVRITRGTEVVGTVAGDLPAALAVDPAEETATFVDTADDGEGPRAVVRRVDLSDGAVAGETELCDRGSVAAADVRDGQGVGVGDCGGEPTLWRFG